jgi:SAM-dependent methyltransferase
MRRLAFGHACFDLVVKLLTSVGLFSSDARHQTVVEEAVRVLRPGGRFILGYRDTRWAMVRKAGLRVVPQLGGYGGAPLCDAAPRLILTAETS